MSKNLKQEIENIRTKLSDNTMLECYNKMISLNTLDDEVDNYTTYFDVNEDDEIIVENAYGHYQLATVVDIEETLKDIEKYCL